MKKFSFGSIAFMIVGLILIGLMRSIDTYVEMVFLLGMVFCLVGLFFSFMAISKQENGVLKYVSLTSFFIVLFLISWFEPFQFVRVLVWLKNIA